MMHAKDKTEEMREIRQRGASEWEDRSNVEDFFLPRCVVAGEAHVLSIATSGLKSRNEAICMKLTMCDNLADGPAAGLSLSLSLWFSFTEHQDVIRREL
jgi:hypothetical protein